MGTSMHVVWSEKEPGRVVYETHTIVPEEDDGNVRAAVRSRRHEEHVLSRAHAAQIAAGEGYELFGEGEAWESLPEE
jgi:16S rRNA C967 or C1407 C5-methylase (RsmB/RsmF family)